MLVSRQALALMQEEAGGVGAVTVLCHGDRLTKAGAAFVNAEMILAGGKWDAFRMLTTRARQSCRRRWPRRN
jgi:hypothetical protein